MAYAPYVCMQTNSTCYKGTSTMTPVGILWHSTGANNPELKRYVQPTDGSANYSADIAKIGKNENGNDWNHISVQAGLNAWIGKFADGTVGTVQSMPWDYKPWGCASGVNGSCNNGWIQFEICEDGLNDKEYAQKVYDEAVALTAHLCKIFKIKPDGFVERNGVKVPTITCHNDAAKLGFASDHADINHWFPKLLGKDMAAVRRDVGAVLDENSFDQAPKVEKKPAATTTKSSKTKKTTNKQTTKSSKTTASSIPYVARVTASALNIRAEASLSSAIVGIIYRNESYTIVEEKNGFGKLKSGAGWISLNYIKKI